MKKRYRALRVQFFRGKTGYSYYGFVTNDIEAAKRYVLGEKRKYPDAKFRIQERFGGRYLG